MSSERVLDIPDIDYDLITMFSVITHMDPEDADRTFRLMRKAAKPGTKLMFSCFAEDQEADFRDENPEMPMLRALYRKGYLEQILVNAGWSIDDYAPPTEIMQHRYLCSPA